jgi:N-acetylmuramoyl-L-alanine amidase CwlA
MDAIGHALYSGNNEDHTSWHFSIDCDTIIQHLELQDRGAHCGVDGKWLKKPLIPCYNSNSIGIEMCQNSTNVVDVLERTAFAINFIRKSYPNAIVVFHSDVTGKDCPRLLSETMKTKFKQIFNYDVEPLTTESQSLIASLIKKDVDDESKSLGHKYDAFATKELVQKVMMHTVISVGADLAQCYLETSAGTSDRYLKNKNPGMCKYTDSYVAQLKEAGIDVKKDPEIARDGGYFCTFPTVWEGWKARKIKLSNVRYDKAKELAKQNKIFESLQALETAGYAGDDKQYAEKIYEIYKREKFDRFDQ